MITLKALTYEPTGGIIAAPTTSLPEQIGGTRNWDYRFCWLRDATLTLLALMDAGYYDEAIAWREWLLRAIAGSANQAQIMYGVAGERRLTEWEVPWLPGYEGSRPVRVGNGAHDQLQLDIYGELMDAVYLFNKYGKPISYDLWQNLRRLLDWLCEHWRLPDQGIWQRDDGQYAYLSSRVMAWVAIDRGIRLAIQRSLPAPVDRWYRVRDDIFQDIFAHFWDDDLRVFVQREDTKILDAATLLMPLVKFISPTDPRWLSTLNAIGRTLLDDTLVHRTGNAETGMNELGGK
ncbi:MAG TPA: glycoside hydrolase family 15 protein, partial [Burkholderiaceae bacterium]|nr:glycoside hydrolase family 15 protein [Burkholderiaceae bacterium]